MNIPFSTLQYMHEEIASELTAAFDRVRKSGWFIQGAACDAFDREWADYCGVKYAVGCGNGLDAITLILRALGIGAGDEVIVPSFTFIATALAVEYAGARPVFAEIDPETALLDPVCFEKAITDKTKAVIPVHLFGQIAPMNEINAVSKKYGLNVVEDAAQAHGARYNGKRAGALGDAAAFSFYPGKNLGALGDGGSVVTDDATLAQAVRAIGCYGSAEKYIHDYKGVNSRLDEMQAAFLSAKLPHLDRWNARRQEIARRYLAEIRNKKLTLPVVKHGEPVWHLFVVQCRHRDTLQTYLKQNGIGTNIHYPIPMHCQKAYSDYGLLRGSYPIAEKLSDTVLSLPLYYGMTEEQVDTVIRVLNDF